MYTSQVQNNNWPRYLNNFKHSNRRTNKEWRMHTKTEGKSAMTKELLIRQEVWEKQ